MATFHLLSVGDLVYKLNPGPVDNATRNPGETNDEQSHKRITGKTSNNIILHINSRSLLRHIDELRMILKDKTPAFVAIAETWLDSTVHNIEVDI